MPSWIRVTGEGLEPSRPFGQVLLRHPCLPFHHPAKLCESAVKYTDSAAFVNARASVLQ